jgi:hypothetical protein
MYTHLSPTQPTLVCVRSRVGPDQPAPGVGIGSGMAGIRILTACLMLLTACAGATPEPTRMVLSTDAGQFRISVISEPSPIPINEPFELSIAVERTDGSPAAGLTLDVDGWMPNHGHGMLRRAAVEDLGDGQYRVRGMLMHMGGLWELRVAVAWRETSDESFQILRDQGAFAVEL